MNFLQKELDLQDKVWDIKLIKKALDERECDEFEVALQHKSQLQVYRKVKRKIGFEDYLEYVKAAPPRLFFKFCWGTLGLFEELSRHAMVGGSQECPNCEACKK